ncbi:hypothetical protein BGW80DRAFT_1299182 [Lactifluus volemus]|nr:hypothetical protein BGW80DRAFT_1299182 [Lactifluus volemus]
MYMESVSETSNTTKIYICRSTYGLAGGSAERTASLVVTVNALIRVRVHYRCSK